MLQSFEFETSQEKTHEKQTCGPETTWGMGGNDNQLDPVSLTLALFTLESRTLCHSRVTNSMFHG